MSKVEKSCCCADGTLDIYDNGGLEDISALSGITELPLDLVVTRNPRLLSLQGLHNIKKLTLGLVVSDNAALVDLSGLEGLDSIGAHLIVANNHNLLSLKVGSVLAHIWLDLVLASALCNIVDSLDVVRPFTLWLTVHTIETYPKH